MVIDSNNSIKPGGSNSGHRPASVTSRESDAASKAPEQARSSARDRVNLSAEAQSMNRLEENLAQLPDVDSERVASLKQAIAEGRFDINPERIAENMLNQDELLG